MLFLVLRVVSVKEEFIKNQVLEERRIKIEKIDRGLKDFSQRLQEINFLMKFHFQNKSKQDFRMI